VIDHVNAKRFFSFSLCIRKWKRRECLPQPEQGFFGLLACWLFRHIQLRDTEAIDAHLESPKCKWFRPNARLDDSGHHWILARDGLSAYGPKWTCTAALHMSAFGGKADMPFCTANVCY
jgi:hypothetical protein